MKTPQTQAWKLWKSRWSKNQNDLNNHAQGGGGGGYKNKKQICMSEQKIKKN